MYDFVALSLVGLGMVVANVVWSLRSHRPKPKARLAEVIHLSQYRRR